MLMTMTAVVEEGEGPCMCVCGGVDASECVRGNGMMKRFLLLCRQGEGVAASCPPPRLSPPPLRPPARPPKMCLGSSVLLVPWPLPFGAGEEERARCLALGKARGLEGRSVSVAGLVWWGRQQRRGQREEKGLWTMTERHERPPWGEKKGLRAAARSSSLSTHRWTNNGPP